MDDKRRIRIMRNALNAILLESNDPFIKVYAQSALDETIDEDIKQEENSYCKKHHWFGVKEEKCPLC